jgi:hypothetical protein
MQCHSCGAEVETELNYCKQCGVNLKPIINTAQSRDPQIATIIRLIIIALTFLTFFGLPIFIASARNLIKVGVGTDALVFVIFLGFISILGVEFVLVRLLYKLIGAYLNSNSWLAQSKQVSNQQNQCQAPSLFNPPTQISSVTEHTTRSMDRALLNKPPVFEYLKNPGSTKE